MSTQDQGKVWAVLLVVFHGAFIYYCFIGGKGAQIAFVTYVILAFLVTWYISPWLQGDENKPEKALMSYVLAAITGFGWVILDTTNRKDA